jgi:hypothetical protein
MEIIKINDSIYVNYDEKDCVPNTPELEIQPGSIDEFERVQKLFPADNIEYIEFEEHQGGEIGRSIYHVI